MLIKNRDDEEVRSHKKLEVSENTIRLIEIKKITFEEHDESGLFT